MTDLRTLQTRILRGVILLVFGVILANLFSLQIVHHAEYVAQSLENRQVRARVKAPRGRILDRDGRLLADNVYIADITLPRGSVGESGPDSTVERLVTWFGLPRDETLERLREQQAAGRPRLTLVTNATMPQIAVVEERSREIPGAKVEARARRRYLDGPAFSHVIGYVGEAVEDEIGEEDDPNAYRPGDWVGREGIEAAWEDRLRGQAGSVLKEVNAAGRVVGRRDRVLRPVTPGGDVVLTLSQALQDTLAAAMGAYDGCAVALALPSGEVLAAVDAPTYDPNLFTTGISVRDWRDLQSDPGHPFLNRMVQAAYPPGSPYKVVTALTALENHVAGPGTRFEPCYGSFRFGNRNFRCWKREGHGDINLTGALIHSCDVYFYQLGLRLTLEQLASTAHQLGLGETTGSPFRGEVSGNIPTSDWYDQRYGKRRWTRGVMLNNAIGQGEILVTPLQMAVLTARVATGRAHLRPVFVRDPAPAVVADDAPLRMAPANLAWVRSTMEQVVDIGTGMRARLEEIDVAGKTGTAENPHGEDHAWFICFAPASEPEVAMAVILENAGHGGAVAAPVAARWLAAYFAQRGTQGET